MKKFTKLIALIVAGIFVFGITIAHASAPVPDKEITALDTTLTPTSTQILVTTDEDEKITFATLVPDRAAAIDETDTAKFALTPAGKYFAQYTVIEDGGATMSARIAGLVATPYSSAEAFVHPGQLITSTA